MGRTLNNNREVQFKKHCKQKSCCQKIRSGIACLPLLDQVMNNFGLKTGTAHFFIAIIMLDR